MQLTRRGVFRNCGTTVLIRETDDWVSATTRKSLKTQFDDTRNHSEVTR